MVERWNVGVTILAGVALGMILGALTLAPLLPPVTEEPWFKSYQTIVAGLTATIIALVAATIAWNVGRRQRRLTLNLSTRAEAMIHLKENHAMWGDVKALRTHVQTLNIVMPKRGELGDTYQTRRFFEEYERTRQRGFIQLAEKVQMTNYAAQFERAGDVIRKAIKLPEAKKALPSHVPPEALENLLEDLFDLVREDFTTKALDDFLVEIKQWMDQDSATIRETAQVLVTSGDF